MRWLADLVLIVHCGFVLFVTGGLLLTWAGALAGWHWVRNFRFRIVHLAAIVFVAAEALLGVICPLTALEDALRDAPAGESFVARWLQHLLYYSFPEWVFTTAYLAFALAVAATWWFVRPQHK